MIDPARAALARLVLAAGVFAATSASAAAAETHLSLVRFSRDPLGFADRLVVANDRCVTGIMTRDYAAAAVACDDALHEAIRARAACLASILGCGGSRDVALVRVNRAILGYRTGDPVRAQDEAGLAYRLAPEEPLVKRARDALSR